MYSNLKNHLEGERKNWLGNKFTLRPTTQAHEWFSFNNFFPFFQKKGQKKKEIILKKSSVNSTNFAFLCRKYFF
jgi:hypothetical protein